MARSTHSAPHYTNGGRPTGIVCVSDYEPLARARVSAMAWEYLAGGAADEITLRENERAFDRIRLKSRVLVDVSRLDTRCTLLDHDLPHPILLAPIAYQRLYHDEGESAVARGAGAAGAVFVVSSFATVSIEEIARQATGPLWFQLYVQPDRGFTAELVRRVEAAGCRALVVTVDTPILGMRRRELRANFALPPGIERVHLRPLGAAVASGAHRPKHEEIHSAVIDPSLTWKDIDWLRSITRLPVLLKGILSAEDAAQAVASGAAGIIVSNHGARNLDTLPATIDALPGVIEQVAGRMPVLVDGGIRRGTDLLKCLALGASAVMLGRPYLHGLAVAGAEGVRHVVDLLRIELEMAMALTGRTRLAAIDRSVLWPEVRLAATASKGV